VAAIDAWRRKQPDLPSRSEAIRRLIELGLKAKRKANDRRE
jgi:metal-responsive CopG/Arc/MetJ family transcriptional regulator